MPGNAFARRTPLYAGLSLCGATAIFMTLKWRAVQQRSEEAKRQNALGTNYYVSPNRSGGGV